LLRLSRLLYCTTRVSLAPDISSLHPTPCSPVCSSSLGCSASVNVLPEWTVSWDRIVAPAARVALIRLRVLLRCHKPCSDGLARHWQGTTAPEVELAGATRQRQPGCRSQTYKKTASPESGPFGHSFIPFSLNQGAGSALLISWSKPWERKEAENTPLGVRAPPLLSQLCKHKFPAKLPTSPSSALHCHRPARAVNNILMRGISKSVCAASEVCFTTESVGRALLA